MQNTHSTCLHSIPQKQNAWRIPEKGSTNADRYSYRGPLLAEKNICCFLSDIWLESLHLPLNTDLLRHLPHPSNPTREGLAASCCGLDLSASLPNYLSRARVRVRVADLLSWGFLPLSRWHRSFPSTIARFVSGAHLPRARFSPFW